MFQIMKRIIFILLLIPLSLFGQSQPVDSTKMLQNLQTNSENFILNFTQNPDSSYRLVLKFYFSKKAIDVLYRAIVGDSTLQKCKSKTEPEMKGPLSMLVFDGLTFSYEQSSYWDSSMNWKSSCHACFVQANNNVVSKEVLAFIDIPVQKKHFSFSMAFQYDTNYVFFAYTADRIQFFSSDTQFVDCIKDKLAMNRNYRGRKEERYYYIISTEKRYHDFLKHWEFRD
jgi:hypothetical protein